MDCPRELIIFIKEYLGNRKCYIELNSLTSNVFNIEKGVPQGSCLGPILFLLYHCPLPSASHVHLYADDLALIITASPWWYGAAFTGNMQSLGQSALNHLQTYVAVWKQPINSQKNRMAMDTSSSCYSFSFIYYQPTAHSTYHSCSIFRHICS